MIFFIWNTRILQHLVVFTFVFLSKVVFKPTFRGLDFFLFFLKYFDNK